MRVFEGSMVAGDTGADPDHDGGLGRLLVRERLRLADGVYTVEASQTDQAGNTGRSCRR